MFKDDEKVLLENSFEQVFRDQSRQLRAKKKV